MRLRGWAAGLVLMFTGALAAKEPLAECGSYFTKAQEEVFLHFRHTVRRATTRMAAADIAIPRAARANQDIGEIAVIGAGNGVVGFRNPFDLVSKTVSFTPEGAAYKVASEGDSFDSAASLAGTRLALDDDDAERITLPFPFRFYGATYTEAFVNSNGSVSFTKGDLDYSGAFGHFTSAPPTIAGLFTDLNPPSSANGVRLLREPTRVVVTWDNVPLASDSAFNTAQTFQIRLYPSGRIEFTYTGVSPSFSNGVVGLNPGNFQPVSLVDLTATTSTFSTGIAESFTSSSNPEVDLMAAAQRFYQTHDDTYDYIAFYNAMGVPAGAGTVAYELTTRSSGEGYGDIPTETGQQYGSKRQLQAVLNLGPTSQYPTDPFGVVTSRGTIGDSPVTILAHEAGHLWLALVSVPSQTGGFFPPMLGSGLAHWAFPFHTDASVLEGNRIVDQGAGQNPRFRTTATVQHYSAFDQYLMGFRAPQDVPPSFAVLNSGISNSRAPQVGVTFNGTRLDIPVEDVIQAAGRRTPDSTVAQRNFRMAFVLIVPEEGDVPQAAVQQIDGYRTAFETFFREATDDRASISTTLQRSASLSLAPSGGVVLGRNAHARIEISKAATAPLKFTIETPQQIVSSLASVTIPAGATEVEWAVGGNRVGVEELRAIPSDPSYATATARVQVRPLSDLKVQVVNGDKQIVGEPQPVTIRVVDENKVPYSFQPVNVAVSGGGTVDQTTTVTDAYGQAVFDWTPAAGSFNTLAFSIPSVPTSVAYASALGLPAALPGGIVNAASYTSPVAAGGFASIFGGSLAGGTTARATVLPFPTTLGSVRVAVSGTTAQLAYVSDTQINFIVPATIPSGTAQLLIETPLGISAAFPIQVAPVAPGVFFDTATGAGAILISGTTNTTQVQPAVPGDFLEIYTTGLGTAPSATVTIAGVDAQVTYAGNTTIPGLQQVNVRVPAGVPSGSRDLLLKVNGIQANPVKVQIR